MHSFEYYPIYCAESLLNSFNSSQILSCNQFIKTKLSKILTHFDPRDLWWSLFLECLQSKPQQSIAKPPWDNSFQIESSKMLSQTEPLKRLRCFRLLMLSALNKIRLSWIQSKNQLICEFRCKIVEILRSKYG